MLRSGRSTFLGTGLKSTGYTGLKYTKYTIIYYRINIDNVSYNIFCCHVHADYINIMRVLERMCNKMLGLSSFYVMVKALLSVLWIYLEVFRILKTHFLPFLETKMDSPPPLSFVKIWVLHLIFFKDWM
jgi:hypothetical protein